jgi:FkbM family methyltransferase
MASTNATGKLYRALMMFRVYRNPMLAFRNRLVGLNPGQCTYRLRPNTTLVVDAGPHDVRQINEIWIDCVYALDQTFRPRPGWSVLDVGANKGVFSAWAATQMGHGSIRAVEPDLRSLEVLVRNTSQFGEMRIDAIHGAARPTRDAVSLYLSKGATGLTSMYGPKRQGTEFRSAVGETITAPGLTLEDIVGTSDIDLMKIDIEGGEYDFLLSAAPATLRRVRRIVLEYDLTHPVQQEITCSDLEEHLRGAGFSVQPWPTRRLMFASL